MTTTKRFTLTPKKTENTKPTEFLPYKILESETPWIVLSTIKEGDIIKFLYLSIDPESNDLQTLSTRYGVTKHVLEGIVECPDEEIFQKLETTLKAGKLRLTKLLHRAFQKEKSATTANYSHDSTQFYRIAADLYPEYLLGFPASIRRDPVIKPRVEELLKKQEQNKPPLKRRRIGTGPQQKTR